MVREFNVGREYRREMVLDPIAVAISDLMKSDVYRMDI